MKREDLLWVLLVVTWGLLSTAVKSQPARSAQADKSGSGCSSWVEITAGGEPFSLRFPVTPRHSTSEVPDGRRWDVYVAGEGDKIFSLRYRKKGSDEGKWSQLIFDDLELARRPHKDILWQSACLLDGYSAVEEVQKGAAGYYWRELRISSDRYLYSVSMGARTAEGVESGEAQCFFESVKLRASSP